MSFRPVVQHFAFSLIVFASFASLTVSAHAQGYLFNQMAGFHETWGTGGGLYYSPAIAQGDFNGDGRLDFAVIDLYQNVTYNGSGYFIDIYLGQPDGTYKQAHSYPAYGSTIAIGDINGDGKLDLVYGGSGSNTISVQLGNGDGSFQNPIFTTTTTSSPASIILGDFNKDGKLDLAYVDNSASVYVQLGDGNGEFQSPVSYSLQNCEPGQVIAADFNKDSKLDLAVACTYGPETGTYVLLGNGDGTFGTPVNYAAGAAGVAAADLNKDGNLDLIVSGSPTGLSVLLGNGDGTFQAPISTNVVGNLGGNIVVADLNGDGKLDVAMAGGWVGVVILLGNGNGTFRSPVYAYGSLQVSGGYSGLLTGDYNFDGKPDLVAIPYFQNGDSFSILTNNGDGTFGSESDYAAATVAEAVVAGDFNGDGYIDLAVSDYSSRGGQIAVYPGEANGKFSTPVLTATSFEPSAMVTGDFNHDGKLDLAALGKGNHAYIFLGQGTGKFATAVSYATGATPSSIATVDLNKDGNLDLVISDSGDSNLTVLLGNSTGTFQAAKFSNTTVSGCGNVSVADFNGDGIPDIGLACNLNINPTIEVMLGNGDGTFQAPSSVVLPSGAQFYSLAVADLRGNGLSDLVVGILNQANLNCPAYCTLVYLGNGDGTFQSAPVLNYGPVGSTVAFADFNGDGKLDIAITGLNSFVALMLGNGDGTFQPALQYQVPHADANIYTASLAIADFNADGSPDLAVTSWGGTNDAGYLTVILSNPVAAFSSAKIAFGSVAVNSKSTRSLTITNQSPTKLTINSISITGTAANDYSQTNTCGASLAAYANCKVSVTFKPSVTGARNATLNFADSAAGPTRTIPLTGTGH